MYWLSRRNSICFFIVIFILCYSCSPSQYRCALNSQNLYVEMGSKGALNPQNLHVHLGDKDILVSWNGHVFFLLDPIDLKLSSLIQRVFLMRLELEHSDLINSLYSFS